MRNGDWIQTYTGRQFWPFDPRPEDVCIEDIAHALSNECRYAGHTSHFYSVAQHSVLVSQNVPKGLELVGLLHDAEEAYFKDMPRPIKHAPWMEIYRTAARRCRGVIFERFLGYRLEEMPPEVEAIDRAMLRTEQRDLMKPAPVEWEDNRAGALENVNIRPWRPIDAEATFLIQFRDFYKP